MTDTNKPPPDHNNTSAASLRVDEVDLAQLAQLVLRLLKQDSRIESERWGQIALHFNQFRRR